MEYVYTGRDNRIDLQLRDDSSGVLADSDLSGVSKVEIVVDDLAFNSVDDTDYFSLIDASLGKIYMTLGDAGIPAGIYCADIIIYDSFYPDGIVWDTIDLTVS